MQINLIWFDLIWDSHILTISHSRNTLYSSRWEVRDNLSRFTQLMDEAQAYGGTFSAELRAVSSYTELNVTYKPVRNTSDTLSCTMLKL